MVAHYSLFKVEYTEDYLPLAGTEMKPVSAIANLKVVAACH